MHMSNNLFKLKEDNHSQRNCQNQFNHPSLSHRARISGGFDSRKDSYLTKFERIPQIFVKLNSRELCDSKLSGLHPFDNMAIIHRVKNKK